MANATIGYSFAQPQLRAANGVTGAGVATLLPHYDIVAAALGYSGLYKVAGATVLNGEPLPRCLVSLVPAANPAMTLISLTSGADGSFLFDGVAPGRYTVQGYDLTNANNGTMKVNVLAVPR